MDPHADVYNLQNIEPLQLNTTYLNDTSQVVTNIFAIVYDAVGDAWFIFSMWGIFIFLNWLFYRREEGFGYDVSRAMLISSGACFFISVAIILAGWVSTIYPIIWFSTLTFVSFVMVYALKLKNQ